MRVSGLERIIVRYTLTISPADDNEWNAVLRILATMGIDERVLVDKTITNSIYIAASPVTLERIISVIAGTLYEE